MAPPAGWRVPFFIQVTTASRLLTASPSLMRQLQMHAAHALMARSYMAEPSTPLCCSMCTMAEAGAGHMILHVLQAGVAVPVVIFILVAEPMPLRTMHESKYLQGGQAVSAQILCCLLLQTLQLQHAGALFLTVTIAVVSLQQAGVTSGDSCMSMLCSCKLSGSCKK